METPFKVGESYLIRTVTYFALGRVKEIIGTFIVLENASWVADTGRFSAAINSGTLEEVEKINGLYRVNTQAIVDFFDWTHPLPTQVK